MDLCHPPLFFLIGAHTSLDSWPLENVLRAFIRPPSIASLPPKYPWALPMRLDLKPTLTSLHDPGPTLHLVATACSVAIVVGLVALAACLLVWRSMSSPTKPDVAVLSEAAILRIHEITSRQPYPMPPDDGGDDGTIPALPFAQNPRKQSLFLFLLFLLVLTGVAAYLLSPLWMVAVSRHIAEQHTKLSWTLALILSTILANTSDRFCQFGFFLWPVVRSLIDAVIWTTVTLLFQPVATAHSASLQVTRIAHHLSRWYLRVPVGPLPQGVDRSTTLMSSAVSVVGGYHLVSGRVARNYMLIVKAMVEQPAKLVRIYSSLGAAYGPILPTRHFQSWAWWATKHILTFTLGELSWRSISWSKLSVLLGPSLVICSYKIYQYNQVIIPPQSRLKLLLDPIHLEQRRQAVEQADMKRLLQKLVANAGLE